MEKGKDSVGPVIVITLTWHQDVLVASFLLPGGAPHTVTGLPGSGSQQRSLGSQAPRPALWPASTLGWCTGQLFLRNPIGI